MICALQRFYDVSRCQLPQSSLFNGHHFKIDDFSVGDVFAFKSHEDRNHKDSDFRVCKIKYINKNKNEIIIYSATNDLLFSAARHNLLLQNCDSIPVTRCTPYQERNFLTTEHFFTVTENIPEEILIYYYTGHKIHVEFKMSIHAAQIDFLEKSIRVLTFSPETKLKFEIFKSKYFKCLLLHARNIMKYRCKNINCKVGRISKEIDSKLNKIDLKSCKIDSDGIKQMNIEITNAENVQDSMVINKDNFLINILKNKGSLAKLFKSSGNMELELEIDGSNNGLNHYLKYIMNQTELKSMKIIHKSKGEDITLILNGLKESVRFAKDLIKVIL